MDRYFYAGGRKLKLELDEHHVAVPLAAAAKLGVSVPTDARELPGNVALVRRDGFKSAELALLRKAGALLAVYAHGGTLMVPLPEVRVELEEGQLAPVLRAVKQASVRADVIQSSPDRLLITPRSGLGDDALQLANEITERAKPAMSAARMVQVTARPDVMRGKRAP